MLGLSCRYMYMRAETKIFSKSSKTGVMWSHDGDRCGDTLKKWPRTCDWGLFCKGMFPETGIP